MNDEITGVSKHRFCSARLGSVGETAKGPETHPFPPPPYSISQPPSQTAAIDSSIYRSLSIPMSKARAVASVSNRLEVLE